MRTADPMPDRSGRRQGARAMRWLVAAALLLALLRLGQLLQASALSPSLDSDEALLAHILGSDVDMLAAIEHYSPADISIAWRSPPDDLALSRAQWLWLGLPGLRPNPQAEYAVAFTTDPPRGTILYTTAHLRLERRIRFRLQ